MNLARLIRVLALTAAGLALFMAPSRASAQSCALCYTQAASSGSRMIQALKSGILILIVPPTFMSLGVILVCYRKRNQTRDGNDDDFTHDPGDFNVSSEPKSGLRWRERLRSGRET